ncbi:hypothetical protein TBC1_11920 [Lentimicrobium saccharophilum]|uniref:Oxygen tolerance n=2 Tax=Lentimicrobium saccharophilum TaxID=1678841 RepID=A0A0S7BR74_9BACT|nr:hypothetical protein TBC1_11920 [Lentimicrobium saccharophilum]
MEMKGALIIKNTGKLTGLFILLLLCPFHGIGQKATPDTTRFLIGQQINVTLELQVQEGTLVNWPVFGDTITKSLEIISVSGIDSLKQENTNDILLRQIIRITSFDSGYHVLPPVSFAIKEAGSNEFKDLLSEASLLEVMNVAVDLSADIKDIKPVLKAPYTLRDFLPYFLILLGLGLAGLLLWYYLQNRKKNKPLIRFPLKPDKPAHLVAIEQLEELKREQLWQKGQVKEYYTRLTDILRTYFEARFQVDAMEKTSDEILDAMRDHLADAGRMEDLRKILTLSDMAKFAKARPLGADNELSHTLAVSVVNSSIPAPSRPETGSVQQPERNEQSDTNINH